MRLYVIRHGQKASPEPNRGRDRNPPLTDRGERQVNHLAEFLADEELDAVYSSSQLRALQTAERVHDRVDADWHVWPLFCETDQRRWEDRHADCRSDDSGPAAWPTGDSVPADSAHVDDPDARYTLSELPDEFPGVRLSQPFPWPDAWWVPTRGQTHAMGYARVELGLQALLDRHGDGGGVAIVCHGNAGDKALTSLLDMPRRRQSRRFSFSNTGVSRLDRRGAERWGIVYVNRTDHLPPELRDSERVF